MKNKFSLALKFAIVSGVYSLLAGVFALFILTKKSGDIDVTELELSGMRYLSPVMLSLTDISGLQVLLVSLDRNSSVSSNSTMDALETRLEKNLEKIMILQRTDGQTLRVEYDVLANRNSQQSHPEKMIETWKRYKSASSWIAKTQDLAHLSQSLRDLKTHVVGTSHLILDPDLDSYYLIDALTNSLLKSIEYLQKSLESSYIISKNAPSFDEHSQHIIHLKVFHDETEAIVNKTQESIRGDEEYNEKNQRLQTDVYRNTKAYSERVNILIAKLSNQKIDNFALLNKEALELLVLGEQLVQLDHLVVQELLHRRLEIFQGERLNFIVAALVCVMICAIVAFFMQRSVTIGAAKTFTKLKRVSDDLKSSSRILSEGAIASTRASTEGRSLIQDIGIVLNETSDLLSETSKKSADTSDLARDALEHAERGNVTIQQMTKSMADISTANQKLREISKIIEDIAGRANVINDIVFKTQLLAVNASIEAARAGQHGKGFAVVAKEVANLASLSGRAATEINHMLEESRFRVAKIVADTSESAEVGRKIAATACTEFELISKSIHEIHDKIHHISDATTRGAGAIAQTLEAMSGLRVATDNNNRLAVENAKISEEITQQAIRLVRIEQAMKAAFFGDSKRSSKDERKKLNPIDAILDGSGSPVVEGRAQNKVVDPLVSQKSLEKLPSQQSSKGPQVRSKVEIAARISKKAGMKFDSLQVTPSEPTMQPKIGVAFEAQQFESLGKPYRSKEAFDPAVDPINSEYQSLIKAIEHLEESSLSGESLQLQQAILDSLLEASKRYFDYEEQVLDRLRLPESDDHKIEHQLLLEELKRYSDRAKRENRIDPDLITFLKDSFCEHMTKMDMKFSEFALNKRKSA